MTIPNPFSRAADYIGAAIGLWPAIWVAPSRRVRRLVLLTFPVSLPLGFALAIFLMCFPAPIWGLGAGIVGWVHRQWGGPHA